MSRRNPNKKGKEDDDLYVVEKVINRRINSEGHMEYLLKWQGFPMEDCTWEPEQNIECPDLIAEFEREEKQKQLENVTPSCPGTSVSFDTDREAQHIVGVTKAHGELVFLIKFKDGTADLVPASEANNKFAEKVLEFYERNLRIEPAA